MIALCARKLIPPRLLVENGREVAGKIQFLDRLREEPIVPVAWNTEADV